MLPKPYPGRILGPDVASFTYTQVVVVIEMQDKDGGIDATMTSAHLAGSYLVITDASDYHKTYPMCNWLLCTFL
jgi:hypothetical protein